MKSSIFFKMFQIIWKKIISEQNNNKNALIYHILVSILVYGI